MTTFYAVATGTWDGSNTSIWSLSSGGSSGAGPPSSADPVIFNAASGAITVTIGAGAGGPVCNSIDCTGYTGILTGSGTITVGHVPFGTVGNITFVGTMDLGAGVNWLIVGWTGTTCQLTTNDKPMGSITLENFVTVSQQDDVTCGAWSLVGDTAWTTNNHHLTVASVSDQPGLGNATAWNMGSSTITVTGGGASFIVASVNVPLTINPGTSTIVFNQSAGFLGGGYTFNNVEAPAGVTVTLNDNSTFNALVIDAGGTMAVKHGQTVTISNIISNGVNGNLANLGSDLGGNQGTLSTSSTIVVDYVSIADSHGSGTGSYTALCHSVNGGDNTNWTFITPCPNDATLPTLSAPCTPS